MEAEPDLQQAGDFVERFAAAMVASGIPRMPARVFALLSASGLVDVPEVTVVNRRRPSTRSCFSLSSRNMRASILEAGAATE